MNLSDINIINGIDLIEFISVFFAIIFSLYCMKVPGIRRKELRLFLILGFWVIYAFLLFIPQSIGSWLFRVSAIFSVTILLFLVKRKVSSIKK